MKKKDCKPGTIVRVYTGLRDYGVVVDRFDHTKSNDGSYGDPGPEHVFVRWANGTKGFIRYSSLFRPDVLRLCIQCDDSLTGKTGTFLTSPQYETNPFPALSPVMDLLDLYQWIRVHGYETAGLTSRVTLREDLAREWRWHD